MHHHPVTNSAPPPRQRPAPLSAAERQRRYRTGRSMVSIDISGNINTLIQNVRRRTGLTTDQLLARALDLLRAELDRSAPLSAAGASSLPDTTTASARASPPSSPAGTTAADTGRPAVAKSEASPPPPKPAPGTTAADTGQPAVAESEASPQTNFFAVFPAVPAPPNIAKRRRGGKAS